MDRINDITEEQLYFAIYCVTAYEAMKMFYLSPISKMIYKKETGLFTQSAASIAYRCVEQSN